MASRGRSGPAVVQPPKWRLHLPLPLGSYHFFHRRVPRPGDLGASPDTRNPQFLRRQYQREVRTRPVPPFLPFPFFSPHWLDLWTLGGGERKPSLLGRHLEEHFPLGVAD